MSNLKEIKRKIKSVYNTQKTTNAMKLVSTAKLKKAEEAARKSKVYAEKIDEMLSEISFQINKIIYNEDDSRFALFHKRNKIQNVDLIFITADKGLCGGFNIKTLKAVNDLLKDYKAKNINVRLKAIGKTGVEYFSFQRIELFEKYIGLSSTPSYEQACSIIHSSVNDYINGITDEVILIHNGYKNMITQELKVSHLIPVEPKKNEAEPSSLLELEPDNVGLLEDLIKTYLEYNIYYALIDSLAAEHSARMQAMDNATNNAKTRVKQLNLAYNKARQESITTELIEIISGVESMK
ncbi:ATP synthase F1 subunit gamma [Campylobacter sp. LH-2024]|uniref:ATP synthase F1 subunit gamma n=1 Tax=Campylobacter TaxID=194 RepID=UPI0019033E1F|nr:MULTISPECIES: ATP synthase F1 subunit gamma [unclassified Campylobacter]MBZ7929927.1 F0F1 ATP synthase subunit gamma [Campylobacter sp. W0067]MBZ7931375.1 F0F1 ATP synthase subunit gamma [Campylobacter sp. RM12910]MBZ7932963.1 F0F1 ATP synthase subunit gamma [Campylobacter sp. RM10543]MBZ7937417.1 F0F1 ATP synthase subunit gamma [Campylobacter sp. RM10538]MBZ7940877.1 F0F1 ATP synthase subunit gamma [Campylobacter sp. W0047]MBZ7943709.1 F0F1 ATP synthase subunit gamma [Campylobacter sp. RM